MADEWSKPVNLDDGEWRVDLDLGAAEGHILLAEGEVYAERTATGDDGRTVFTPVTAPRDVVLRLLAAEASDRLGWVWHVEHGELGGLLGSTGFGPRWLAKLDAYGDDFHPVAWFELKGSEEGTLDLDKDAVPPLDTPDGLLAAMHGRFLLEDAIREAANG